MDILTLYWRTILDVGLILVFAYLLFSNLHLSRLMGALKGLGVVAVMWFIARTLDFPLAEATFRYIVQFSFLALMIMFPKDFQQLLEHIGRRRMFNMNTQGLIRNDSRKELAKAVITMARKRQGGILVIARESGLEDEIMSGEFIGEMSIKQSFIELLTHRESKVSSGAVIIKDDQIVSVNAILPLTENKQLESVGAGKRHLAGLGIVADKDCVSIIVSGETGAITMVGKFDGVLSVDFAMPLKEVDVVDGIDEDFILYRIEEYLKGTSKTNKQESKAKSSRKQQEAASAKRKQQQAKKPSASK